MQVTRAATPATTPGRLTDRAVALRFTALALTWGSSFLLVAVTLRDLTPPQVVLGRLLAGALVLAAVAAARRTRLPRDPVLLGHLTVVGVLLCVVPFLLFAWAQQRVPSGVASILNATTPLMTLAVAMAALPDERPTRARTGGLLLGLAGVLLVLAPWSGPLGGDLLAHLACLGATACYGAGFVYLRRFVAGRGLDAVAVATVQVGTAAALAAVLVPLVAPGPVRVSATTVLAVLALGGLGTGLAYVWNTTVVTAWGASTASTVTYLTPVVGVALGAALLGERLGWHQPTGAVLVVLGILLGQQVRGRAAPDAPSGRPAPATPPGSPAARTSGRRRVRGSAGRSRRSAGA